MRCILEAFTKPLKRAYDLVIGKKVVVELGDRKIGNLEVTDAEATIGAIETPISKKKLFGFKIDFKF